MQRIARSIIVKIERYMYGSGMIKVRIKAVPVDVLVIQIYMYMPTTIHKEKEADNVRESGGSIG